MYEGLGGNKNAEKWTLEVATELFDKAILLSEDKESEDNDFIGEVAQSLKVTIDILSYLIVKFPELNSKYTEIKRNCEANCFKNGKKGKINTSMAIMNLKSNHGWTDRVATDNKNDNVNQNHTLTPEEYAIIKAKKESEI